MKTLKEELTADIQKAVKEALERAPQSDIFQRGIDCYVQSWLDGAVCYLMDDDEVLVQFGEAACAILPLIRK